MLYLWVTLVTSFFKRSLLVDLMKEQREAHVHFKIMKTKLQQPLKMASLITCRKRIMETQTSELLNCITHTKMHSCSHSAIDDIEVNDSPISRFSIDVGIEFVLVL